MVGWLHKNDLPPFTRVRAFHINRRSRVGSCRSGAWLAITTDGSKVVRARRSIPFAVWVDGGAVGLAVFNTAPIERLASVRSFWRCCSHPTAAAAVAAAITTPTVPRANTGHGAIYYGVIAEIVLFSLPAMPMPMSSSAVYPLALPQLGCSIVHALQVRVRRGSRKWAREERA